MGAEHACKQVNLRPPAPSRFLNILFCCIVILYNHWFLTSVLSSRNTRFSAGEVEGVLLAGSQEGGS